MSYVPEIADYKNIWTTNTKMPDQYGSITTTGHSGTNLWKNVTIDDYAYKISDPKIRVGSVTLDEPLLKKLIALLEAIEHMEDSELKDTMNAMLAMKYLKEGDNE